MSQERVLVCISFVGILFIAIGIFGIKQKINFSKKVHSMQKLTGVIVDFEMAFEHGEDHLLYAVYSPAYEYNWRGVTKRLDSTVCKKSKPRIGKTVHILVDPGTTEVFCLEDERTSQFVPIFLGVIGVAILILVILLKIGILP